MMPSSVHSPYDARIAAIREAASEELARRRLLPFATRVRQDFETPRHIEYIADNLERVECGEIKRLAISCPPGHGKSTLLDAFAAWCLGRDGRRRLLCISATENLAKRNSRDAQEMVESPYWPFDVRIKTDSVLDWTLNSGGGVRAIGYAGTVTGFRFEGIIADDLQPDPGTEQSRKEYEEWFRSVLTTRLEPNGWCIVIQTRWHDGDIIGRLVDGPSAKMWKIVNLPALAKENDPLGRIEGEALWESRWPREILLARKAEMFSGAFSAEYQGEPVPAEGSLIKREWLRYEDNFPTEYDRTVIAIDAASKTGVANDWSAVVVVGVKKNDYFVLDVNRQKVELPQLHRLTVNMYKKHCPARVYCEDASAGIGLIQALRQNSTMPIVGVKPKGSKISRVEGQLGIFESGRVHLLKSAPWLAALEDEMFRFPACAHDDMVDALILAIQQCQRQPVEWSFAFANNSPIEIPRRRT